MSNTSNLALPYLAAGQAQKHVTLNDSLRRLDAIVQLSVVSATTSAQPGSPSDGAVYIVPSGKSGADWSAYANWSLGYYRDGAWEQVAPREGWLACVQDTDLLLHYTGSAWEQFAPDKLMSLSASDRLVGRSSSGAGAAEEIVCTAAGRALLDDADARAQCSTLGAWRVLAAGAVAVSHTGDTTETVLATVNVPGGAMGPNGALRVTAQFSHTNSANMKTLNVKLGGVSGRAFVTSQPTTSDGNIYQRTIHNRNAQNAQVSQQHNTGVSYGAGSPRTGTIDTSAAQDLVFTATLANAGETVTLESYLVELFHGA